MSKKTYVSQKDKKCVTVLKGIPSNLMNKVTKLKKDVDRVYCSLQDYDKFIGVAECQEPDQFDEKLGKDISNIKALMKKYDKLYKKSSELYEVCRDVVFTFDDISEKFFNKFIAVEGKYKELL